MTVSPDFASGIVGSDERVISRNRIWETGRWMIDVDAQDRCQQIADVLTCAFRIRWKRRGGVAGRDVKESVFRAKLQRTTVMAASLPGDDALLGGSVNPQRIN